MILSRYFNEYSILCLVVAGFRTVPIELGSNYLADDASQKLMTLNEFFDNFIIKSHEDPKWSKAYFAQHEFLEQVAALKKHVIVPDYCSLLLDSDEIDETGAEVIINTWMGPVGTMSPLHHDPYHNILAQVSGRR